MPQLQNPKVPSDNRIAAASDVFAGFSLLTRIRVPAVAPGRRSIAKSAWLWPLIGALLASLAYAVGVTAIWLGLPGELAAGLGIAILVFLTGALHEDGLADCADAFWGGWTKDRRLEILKDSRIGAYGVIALIFSFGFRWISVALLFETTHAFAGLVVAAMLSRTAMGTLMHFLPNARSTGLAANTGRPDIAQIGLAIFLSMIAALLLFGSIGLLLLLVTAGTSAIWGRLAFAKIGGQTGDVLGASQQLCEITVLLAILIAI